MSGLAAARGIMRPGGSTVRASRVGAATPTLSGLLSKLPDWHDDERLPCRSDPNMWFAEDKRTSALAAQTCRELCPRLVECREQAVDDRERWGVWGGMTPAQRIADAQDRDTGRQLGGRPRSLPTCGHDPGEFRWRKRGSVWCSLCDREAAARKHGRPPGPNTDEQIQIAAARRERVMSAYHALAPRRLEHVQAAAELGMSMAAFKNVYTRARREGDPRAVRHTSPSPRERRTAAGAA